MSSNIKIGFSVIVFGSLSFLALNITDSEFGVQEYTNSQVISSSSSNTPVVTKTATDTKPVVVDDREVVQHVALPEHVKAIYMTSCVVGTPSFRERLVNLINETEVNSVIIDIKDFSGTISFKPTHQAWMPAWQNSRCGARDMKEFVAMLHEKDIFTIGRITVFQDPFYTSIRPDLAVKKADGLTVWHDYKGLSFIDVGAKEYWDHILLLSEDAYNIGFDELNYDYVRYPSDGPMSDIAFPYSAQTEYGSNKQANLEAFFTYLSNELADENRYIGMRHVGTGRASNTPWTSADLFGLTTTSYSDLSIGQIQERTAPHFDFVAPMVYPSHYPHGFMGLGNPNDHPYEVVYNAMKQGVGRMKATTTTLEGFQHIRIGTSSPAMYYKPIYNGDKFRTWIQDFDYGGDYDAADVRAQIQASYDAGVKSWMIWAPSNIYTKEALLSATTTEPVR